MGRWTCIAVALVSVAACAGGVEYRPGTIPRPSANDRRVGCIETTAQMSRDLVGGTAFVPGSTPVVWLAFGNACRRPVPVLVNAVRWTAVFPDGSREPMRPSAHVGAAMIDGLQFGAEKLELLDDHGGSTPPSQVCADVSMISTPPTPSPPICLAFLPRLR